MQSRCYNPENDRWVDYGGKGITVCKRWLDSFQSFVDDLGEPPSPEYSLDRIHCNGNYEPINCRWATPEEQANNKSNTRWISFRGETLSIAMFARKAGLRVNTLRMRLNSYGWPVEKALTTPVLSPNQRRQGVN